MPKIVCACSVCRRDIFEGEPMADAKVYKLGELDSILLAHQTCGIRDNAESGRTTWEYEMK